MPAAKTTSRPRERGDLVCIQRCRPVCLACCGKHRHGPAAGRIIIQFKIVNGRFSVGSRRRSASSSCRVRRRIDLIGSSRSTQRKAYDRRSRAPERNARHGRFPGSCPGPVLSGCKSACHRQQSTIIQRTRSSPHHYLSFYVQQILNRRTMPPIVHRDPGHDPYSRYVPKTMCAVMRASSIAPNKRSAPLRQYFLLRDIYARADPSTCQLQLLAFLFTTGLLKVAPPGAGAATPRVIC